MMDHLRTLVRGLVRLVDFDRTEWDAARPFGQPVRQPVRVDYGRVTMGRRR